MTKAEKKKRKERMKRTKMVTRLDLPPHKVHKTMKDYKRKNKVKVQDVEKD